MTPQSRVGGGDRQTLRGTAGSESPRRGGQISLARLQIDRRRDMLVDDQSSAVHLAIAVGHAYRQRPLEDSVHVKPVSAVSIRKKASLMLALAAGSYFQRS